MRNHSLQEDTFTPERRIKRRFDVNASVTYRVQLTGTRCPRAGKGRTVNLSSEGVLFQAEDLSLPAGTLLEVSIVWPVNLDERVGLTLFVTGSVVRQRGDYVAVKIQRAEFRTRKRIETALHPITAGLPLGLASQRSSA